MSDALKNAIREALRRPGGKPCSCFVNEEAVLLARTKCNSGVCEDAVKRVAAAIEPLMNNHTPRAG